MPISELSGQSAKMYILILDGIPSGFAINAAAHASLACYIKFAHMPQVQAWLTHSFKKVTCKVSSEQFKEALGKADLHVIISESALDGQVLGVAFAPREEWDPFFKTLTLWK